MKLIRMACSVRGRYIALVMAVGFLTFCALPDGVPFMVRLMIMVATQYAVGKALRKQERYDEP